MNAPILSGRYLRSSFGDSQRDGKLFSSVSYRYNGCHIGRHSFIPNYLKIPINSNDPDALLSSTSFEGKSRPSLNMSFTEITPTSSVKFCSETAPGALLGRFHSPRTRDRDPGPGVRRARVGTDTRKWCSKSHGRWETIFHGQCRILPVAAMTAVA